jgi:hypothetical protein
MKDRKMKRTNLTKQQETFFKTTQKTPREQKMTLIAVMTLIVGRKARKEIRMGEYHSCTWATVWAVNFSTTIEKIETNRFIRVNTCLFFCSKQLYRRQKNMKDRQTGRKILKKQ